MDPMTIAALASTVGGLFGGGPSIPPEQRRLLQLQTRAAKDLRTFSQGVPGSAPDELAALASQRGLLGQQQRATMGGLFANLGASGSPAQGDLLANLATQFQGQQSALTGQHILQSLQARRNALLQSAQVAAGAVPAAQPSGGGGVDFGSILGNLAQGWAYRNALNKGPQLQQATPGTVNVGGGWTQTPYGSSMWTPGAGNGPGSLPQMPTPGRARGGPFGLF